MGLEYVLFFSRETIKGQNGKYRRIKKEHDHEKIIAVSIPFGLVFDQDSVQDSLDDSQER